MSLPTPFYQKVGSGSVEEKSADMFNFFWWPFFALMVKELYLPNLKCAIIATAVGTSLMHSL